MQDPDDAGELLRHATTYAGTSSFTEFAAAVAPDTLPGRRSAARDVPHGTTIVAATYADGVVMGGDRRATTGNLIAQRDLRKVYAADDHSLIGFAGAVGLAVELVRLYQVELEHFEKIEGTRLSLVGKANRLTTMVRGNLGLAVRGLAAIPLYAGYDPDSGTGRIFSYDEVGGRFAEQHYHAIGSGSLFARGSLKKVWRPDLGREEIVRVVVEALYDAADDDSATGGPDITRAIYPVVMLATRDGVERVGDDELETTVRELLAGREARPGA